MTAINIFKKRLILTDLNPLQFSLPRKFAFLNKLESWPFRTKELGWVDAHPFIKMNSGFCKRLQVWFDNLECILLLLVNVDLAKDEPKVVSQCTELYTSLKYMLSHRRSLPSEYSGCLAWSC